MKSSIPVKYVIFFLLVPFFSISCNHEKNKQSFFEKSVTFPDTASLKTKIKMASAVVPSSEQYEWQKMEMTAFVHFTVNTFTDKEWGDGTESESLFNPSGFDAGQWVKTLRDAGMKMVIITAKHHDGFCLWPTETTNHSVKNSPWKNGQGDVIRDLSLACKKYKMKFGIYLSPWDRNAKCYGNSPEYNRFFLAQLTELLTWYGKVDEVWFDGACGEGPNGKKQEYDWEAYYSLVHKLQPDAVIAVSGEDVRWVGTESGYGRETEWSVTALAPGATKEMNEINRGLSLDATSEDLGSKKVLNKAGRVFWYPSEVDVSIRPGWFYHPSEDNMVKSVNKLVDIYFSSVGRNSVLLLNVPPDRRGLINENDIKSLKGFRQYLDSLYRTDVLIGSRPFGHGTSAVIDKNNLSSWSPSGNNTADFVAPIPVTFNVAMLQEDITKGQRVDSFTIEIKKNDKWETVAAGTTIGYKRLLRFQSVTTDEIRLTINSSRNKPYISTFSLFRAPELLTDPVIRRDKEGTVSLSSESPFSVIKYTIDSSDPTRNSSTWKKPFKLPDGGIVKCRTFINDFSDSSEVVSEVFDLAPLKWKIVRADKPAPGYEPEKAIDGDVETVYRSSPDGTTTGKTHEIVIDLGLRYNLYGFTFNPEVGNNSEGAVERYSFCVSDDGKNWSETRSPGVFANIKNSAVRQTVRFPVPVNGRYIRFRALSEINNAQWFSVAEIGIITKPEDH